MKKSLAILTALVTGAQINTGLTNDSFYGLYECELSGNADALSAMEVRPSGYVFSSIDLNGEDGKQVGSFVIDEPYLIIDNKASWLLFRLNGDTLVAESVGMKGSCMRVDISTDSDQPMAPSLVQPTQTAPEITSDTTASLQTQAATDGTRSEQTLSTEATVPGETDSKLLGRWSAADIDLQIAFNADGSAESIFQKEPPIMGRWQQTSIDTLSLSFTSEESENSKQKRYSYRFLTDNKLELRTEQQVSLVLERIVE